jgi:hypothetical protein
MQAEEHELHDPRHEESAAQAVTISDGPLRKLEQVLLPVDDLESTGLIDRADVSGVKPSLVVKRLLGVLWILVVATLLRDKKEVSVRSNLQ